MAAPIPPEDHMRVQKTFDDVAGPVRLPPHYPTSLHLNKVKI